jgi:sulfur carrier protein
MPAYNPSSDQTVFKRICSDASNNAVFALDFKMIQLIVNGQSRCFPARDRAEAQDDDSSGRGLNITQLLEHMGLQGKRIAVERNGEIVPRSKFGQPMLVDGDRLEIVVAVGGG